MFTIVYKTHFLYILRNTPLLTNCSNLLPMPTPPLASVANTDTAADLLALTNAANTQFIADIITAIAQAEANGQYQCYLTTFEHVDFQFVATYMQGLGYQINFPDFPATFTGQPASLFGPDWIAFWANKFIPAYLNPQNPLRMGFSWAVPTA